MVQVVIPYPNRKLIIILPYASIKILMKVGKPTFIVVIKKLRTIWLIGNPISKLLDFLPLEKIFTGGN